MILIGMLHYRKDPNNVSKAYAYAASAKLEGAELLYFTPNSIDFDTKIIKGHKYINGKWVRVEERFPDVIYRTGLSIKFKKYKSIINKLKQDIPFTTQTIGNKIKIFKILKNCQEIKEHLIPSKEIYSFNELNEYINKYQKIVLKSNRGHRGLGVVYIEKIGEIYHLMTHQTNMNVSYDEYKNMMVEKLKMQLHHVQPYINSKTNTGYSYILRAHIQKNGNDQWELISVFPEISLTESIIANTNLGGATNEIDLFLSEEFPNQEEYIMKSIKLISIKIGKYLEYYTQKYHQQTISEVGIDLGFDEHQKLWIFEVNDLPGCPPTFNLELDLVKYQIQYAMLLAKKHKESE